MCTCYFPLVWALAGPVLARDPVRAGVPRTG